VSRCKFPRSWGMGRDPPGLATRHPSVDWTRCRLGRCFRSESPGAALVHFQNTSGLLRGSSAPCRGPRFFAGGGAVLRRAGLAERPGALPSPARRDHVGYTGARAGHLVRGTLPPRFSQEVGVALLPPDAKAGRRCYFEDPNASWKGAPHFARPKVKSRAPGMEVPRLLPPRRP
jgi:hypothetical protein